MDVKTKNIAFVITSLRGGGAERVASVLIRKYNEDHNVHLIFTDSTHIEYVIPEGVSVKKISYNFKHNFFLNILFIPVYSYKLFLYMRRNNIPVMLSFLSRPNLIACFTKTWGYTGKIVISERVNVVKWFLPGTFSGMIGKRMYKILYPKADFVVTNSRLTAYNMKTDWKLDLNYQVIYNPLEIEKIQGSKDLVQQLPGRNGAFKCIMVGRFDYPKDYATLINTAEILKDRHIDFLFAGSGPGLPEIKKKVTELGLENIIFFAGFDPDPFKYIFAADVFIFSSLFEGFPNVITEAMACGKPVISVDCQSGPREILAPRTDITAINTTEVELAEFGILVPVKDHILFAKAILLLKNDKELRMHYSAASQMRAQDFESKKITAEFSKLLC